MLLALLLTLVFPTMSAAAETARKEQDRIAEHHLSFVKHSKRHPETAARKDVDSGTAARREKAEAALSRSGNSFARVLGGGRTQLLPRGLLCEACFFPFTILHHTIIGEFRVQSGRSPVSIIHFPRPPPSVSL